MSQSRRTILEPVVHEIEPIKKSRFIGAVFPCSSEEQAAELVAQLRKEERGARHHCWAWRLGHPDTRSRCTDDGEPRQTAGPPILSELEGRDLSDVLVVVTRYFGGTKLGPGGLIRAYGAAASEALERAQIVVFEPKRRLTLRYAYDLVGVVRHCLDLFELEPADTHYGEGVEMELELLEERLEEFVREVVDRSRGAVEVELEEP